VGGVVGGRLQREADRGSGERRGGDVGVGEVVEQPGVAEHAADRHGAREGVPEVLHGDGGDLAAHGRPGDEQLAGPQVGDAAEQVDERVGVAHALADVVAVGLVAGGGPGEAALHEVGAQAGVVDPDGGALAAEAVGVQDQLAVPALGQLDAPGGAVLDAGVDLRQRRAGGVGEGRERRAAGEVAPGVGDGVAGLGVARHRRGAGGLRARRRGRRQDRRRQDRDRQSREQWPQPSTHAAPPGPPAADDRPPVWYYAPGSSASAGAGWNARLSGPAGGRCRPAPPGCAARRGR
jgi:hypothetical protein